MTNWDSWEERQTRELEVEAADEWVTEQAKTVHAAAGLNGPWATLHPVAWSYVTGRITASSVPEWRQRYDGDPAGVASALAQCFPALGPQGPQAVATSAGIVHAAGRATLVPSTAASPPRPRGHRNALDELRDTPGGAGLIEAASKGGPPPQMFPGSGDQPRATASGIEVSAIAGLPWRARLAAAWAPKRIDAFRISQDYGLADEDAHARSRGELSGHQAVRQYQTEVEQWARTSGVNVQTALSPDEVAALFPPRPQAS